MKKLTVAVLTVVTMLSWSCADKIQTAKTVLAFVDIGAGTANSMFNSYAALQRTECLKQGVEGSIAFTECYKPTADTMEKWSLIRPRLEKSVETAASYIKAAESGSGQDYVQAVKETVCLLTEVLQIIPGDKWKAKIQMYLDLAGAYTCGTKASSTTTTQDLNTLRLAHRLMQELLTGSPAA